MERLSTSGQIRGIPLGRYVLGPRLAIGGMGEVYLAVQLGLGRVQQPIALKLLLPHLSDSPQAIQMFLDEAQLAARMNHPNVIQIYDVGVAESRYYIAMELVRGVSMSSFIDALKNSQHKVSGALLAYVGRALCDGLHHAHEQVDPDGNRLEVVHRDVTPHNVLLSADGAVKLTDFGIAKARDSATHTRPGYVKGKFEYVAPEQLLGKPLDRRVDIFGAGLTLYHLATLNSPFRRDNELATLHAVERDPLPSLAMLRPDLPHAIRDAITRATQKDPRERFSTARAFRDSLPPGGPEGKEQLAALVRELCKDAVEKLENKTARVNALETGTLGTGSLGEPSPSVPPAVAARSLEEASELEPRYQQVTVPLRPPAAAPPVPPAALEDDGGKKGKAPPAAPALDDREDDFDPLSDVTYPLAALPALPTHLQDEAPAEPPVPWEEDDRFTENTDPPPAGRLTQPPDVKPPERPLPSDRGGEPPGGPPSPPRRGTSSRTFRPRVDTDGVPAKAPPSRPPPTPAADTEDPEEETLPVGVTAPARSLPAEPPSVPTDPREPRYLPRAQPWQGWRRSMVGGGLLGVLTAVALGVWFFRGKPPKAGSPPPAPVASTLLPSPPAEPPPVQPPPVQPPEAKPEEPAPTLAARPLAEEPAPARPEALPPDEPPEELRPVVPHHHEAPGPRAVRVGYLNVDAVPWANVYVQGKKLGRTPVTRFPIESGMVSVTLMNPLTGRTIKKNVRVTGGRQAYVKEDLR